MCVGSMANEAGLKSLKGSLVIDDDQVYSLTSILMVEEKKEEKMRVLTPMVELRRPGAKTITLTGNVEMDNRGRRFNTDLTLSGATQKAMQVQGRKREQGVIQVFVCLFLSFFVCCFAICLRYICDLVFL